LEFHVANNKKDKHKSKVYRTFFIYEMISEILPEEKRRLYELEIQLAELEKSNPSVQVSDVVLGLDEMTARLDGLDKLASRESKGRREDFRRRIQSLRQSHHHIKASLDSFVKRKKRNNINGGKLELFGNADIEGGVPENLVDASASIDRSSRMVSSYISLGQQTLSELISQKDRLKNVHTKVIDILNYLGISNKIMRTVENRDTFDRYLVLTGMVLITLLLILIWYYL
jgi:Golgi SNAP receptor complex protein 2